MYDENASGVCVCVRVRVCVCVFRSFTLIPLIWVQIVDVFPSDVNELQRVKVNYHFGIVVGDDEVFYFIRG